MLGPLFKLLEALIELFIPYVILDMINNGINKDDAGHIWLCVLLLVVMGLVGLAFSLTAQYFSAKAAVGFTARVRGVLFRHIQHLSYKNVDSIGKSTLINRLTSDMNQVQTGINLTLRLFLRSPFIVFGAAIMAYTVDPQVSSVFLYTIPALSVVVFTVMLVGIPLYKKVQGHLDVITSKTRENLSGARMLRALCKEDSEIEQFNESNGALCTSQRFAGRISALINPLTFVIINLAIAILVYKGGVKVEHGGMTNAQVIVIYNYMSQILVELIKLANFIIAITKALACANRVAAILDIETENEIQNNSVCSSDVNTAVEFKDVTFGYTKSGNPAINNVSFKIEQGQTVGIIGGTGSGKSTLVNLICGFYKADNGSVNVLGMNTESTDREVLLSKIGIVPQKSELFSGTIRSNISLGNSNASDEDLYKALEISAAKDFIDKLESGLDHQVEQYGRNFSGGQRQRLTIARSIAKKPEILILDDSSSALDYATDLKLRSNISAMCDGMTVINVSQRASSIKHSDVILVLDEGELVGIGDHDTLYSSCQVYKEICQSQERR